MKPVTRKNIHPVHFTHSHHFWLPEPWPFSRSQWHCNNVIVKVKTKLVFPQKFYLTAFQVWTVYNICWYNGQDHTKYVHKQHFAKRIYNIYQDLVKIMFISQSTKNLNLSNSAGKLLLLSFMACALWCSPTLVMFEWNLWNSA